LPKGYPTSSENIDLTEDRERDLHFTGSTKKEPRMPSASKILQDHCKPKMVKGTDNGLLLRKTTVPRGGSGGGTHKDPEGSRIKSLLG